MIELYNKVYKNENPLKIRTMENEVVEIKEFKVEKLNPYKKVLEVSISYVAKENGKVNKNFSLDGRDTPVKFSTELLEDVRKAAGAFEIEKQDETRDKLANIMIRLVQEIRSLEKVKEHEKFMRNFNKINCYKKTFGEE